MMKKWIALLLVLMLAVLPTALAEGLEIEEEPVIEETEDIVFSEDVDNVAEEEDFMLFSDEPIDKGYADFLTEGDENPADVPIDAAHFPDELFRDYVADHLDPNSDGVLTEAERAAVTELEIENLSISTLQGIEFFTDLRELTCRDLGLKSLDVSRNTELTKLNLPFNCLSSLDVSKNTKLTWLNLNKANHSHPGVTSLDVSHNPELVYLWLNYNSVTSLDVSMCPQLEELYFTANQVTKLDLSNNPMLKELYANRNCLKSLNLNGCSALELLHCEINQLEEMWINDCSSLNEVWCYDNQLTELDVSVTDCLSKLSCSWNPLNSLVLTHSLKNLYCVGTQLTELNLYNCPTLIELSQQTPTLRRDSGSETYYLAYTNSSYEMFTDVGVTFTQVPPTPKTVDISDCEITVGNKTYTGKALKPAVTVKYNGATLFKDTDYTVSYKNNTKVGTATVTVKGIGDYTGSKKITFKIKPKGTTLSKLTGGSKKITVKWKKQSKQVTGYQIQYGTKKDFSGAKKLTVKGAATVKKTIKKLKAKKTYYLRIRTYKTVSGKKYYSSWSKSKKIKTK